jgi:hypothetical protein
MTYYYDTRDAPWQSICGGIIDFEKWAHTHSGYLCIECKRSVRRELETLLGHCGLTDHFCFVDEVPPECRHQFVEVSRPWPLH